MNGPRWVQLRKDGAAHLLVNDDMTACRRHAPDNSNNRGDHWNDIKARPCAPCRAAWRREARDAVQAQAAEYTEPREGWEPDTGFAAQDREHNRSA